MSVKAIAKTATLLALSLSVTAAPHHTARQAGPELSLTTQLRFADTAVERYALLPNNEDFIFNFNSSATGFADAKSFPALVGTGASMALAEIPACGMAPLHLHPRSAELFAVISGRLITEMVPEAGVLDAEGNQRVVRTELGPRDMTVFPMGSFHVQVNPYCEPALAVAGFAAEDAGAGAVVGQTLALGEDVLSRVLERDISGDDVDSLKGGIAEGAAKMMEECLKKCSL